MNANQKHDADADEPGAKVYGPYAMLSAVQAQAKTHRFFCLFFWFGFLMPL